MSEYAYFYNSENGDRVYDADSFSNWLKKFFTTGVFEGDCQVTALGSMVVNLAPGYANIMGKVKELENQTFTLEPADGSYPRIDTIVIERNDTDRDITAKVVTGQFSGNTPAPTPRVWENGVYQLIVAEVYVAAGATEVTQANITDKRSDPDVCGIVAGTVTEMDFSQFTAQFESYFEQFKASNLEEFSEWFEMIKGQLSEDAAGHLQNEIDDINEILGDGLIASNINYDNTHSGMTATKVQGAIDELNDNLTEKVTKFSGTDSGNTYVTVDGLAYDETNKKLGLKVNGADTVIPFSGEPKVIPYSIHTLDGVTIDLGFIPKYLYFWHGDRGNFGIYINNGTYNLKRCVSYENNNIAFADNALTVNGTSITILPIAGSYPSQYRYGDGFVVAFG